MRRSVSDGEKKEPAGENGMASGARALLRCLLFAAVGAALLAGLSRLFEPKNNREDFGMGEMKANGILAEPENTIDVVAVGDSECALAIAPMALWREQGIASYNCGTTGQYLYEAYGYLQQAFERQQIQVVLLETNMIYRECAAQDWLFSKLERLIPALRYHDRWKTLRAEDLGAVEYTWTDEYKGHMFYDDAEPYCEGEYMLPTDAALEISRWNQVCLQEIARLCRDEGASLIFVSAPSPVNWSMEKHNAVQAFADAGGFPYLDLNLMADQVPIDWQTETKDAGDHVNCLGAEKVSVYLGRYLADRYGLADHRDQEEYAGWNEALTVYQEALAAAGTD